jgi:hypothetical protein
VISSKIEEFSIELGFLVNPMTLVFPIQLVKLVALVDPIAPINLVT